jgi:hypothetical protein
MNWDKLIDNLNCRINSSNSLICINFGAKKGGLHGVHTRAQVSLLLYSLLSVPYDICLTSVAYLESVLN